MKFAGIVGMGAVFPPLHLEPVLRPPGAVSDFLARCIRCGQCMETCPYDSIFFFGITAGALIHTPYIDPLRSPCYLCRERGPDGNNRPVSAYLRCGEVCPTGALRRIANDKEVLCNLPEELRMGRAFLNREFCIAWQFNFCGECYLNCPLKDRALLARPPDEPIPAGVLRPHVDIAHCVGCGRCAYICPVRKQAAVSVTLNRVNPDLFQYKYRALVRILLARSGDKERLPAIRVTGRL